MATGDKEPRSTMSRSKETGKVATGGRRIKHHHFPSIHRDTWPTKSDNFKDSDQPSKAPSTKRKRVPKEKTAKPKKAQQQPVKPKAQSVPQSRPPMGTFIAAAAGSEGGGGC